MSLGHRRWSCCWTEVPHNSRTWTATLHSTWLASGMMQHKVHCKDKMPKIKNKYSQKRNIGDSVPISTFMCLWANYILSRWVCLFCWRKYVDWSWEYINRSKTHECGTWGWGRAIPRKGIYKRNCRCSAALQIFCSLRIKLQLCSNVNIENSSPTNFTDSRYFHAKPYSALMLWCRSRSRSCLCVIEVTFFIGYRDTFCALLSCSKQKNY
jgi:hypothetical protein